MGHLYVAVDGSLQCQALRIDVREGIGRVRVYLRSSVPAGGLEFDGCGRVGDSFGVRVFDVRRGEILFGGEAVLYWFAVGQNAGEGESARYVFVRSSVPQ